MCLKTHYFSVILLKVDFKIRLFLIIVSFYFGDLTGLTISKTLLFIFRFPIQKIILRPFTLERSFHLHSNL